jgi:hypothetical protein
MAEAFVKTFKRDYVRDAASALIASRWSITIKSIYRAGSATPHAASISEPMSNPPRVRFNGEHSRAATGLFMEVSCGSPAKAEQHQCRAGLPAAKADRPITAGTRPSLSMGPDEDANLRLSHAPRCESAGCWPKSTTCKPKADLCIMTATFAAPK